MLRMVRIFMAVCVMAMPAFGGGRDVHDLYGAPAMYGEPERDMPTRDTLLKMYGTPPAAGAHCDVTRRGSPARASAARRPQTGGQEKDIQRAKAPGEKARIGKKAGARVRGSDARKNSAVARRCGRPRCAGRRRDTGARLPWRCCCCV